MSRIAIVFLLIMSGCVITRPHVTVDDKAAGQPALSQTALTGRVTDPQGGPVEGARLTAYSGMATRWRIGEATTDGTGTYRFDPFPGGAMIQNETTGGWDYLVGITIDHPGFASADGLSWWDVTCTSGKETRKDFQMQRAGAVEGQLLGPGGRPMPNVGMRFQSPAQDNVRFHRYAMTGADGSFHETGLAPGEYVADINHHPYPITGRFRIDAGLVTRIDLKTEAR